MSELFCMDCSRKSIGLERLPVGTFGTRKCVVCGKIVRCNRDSYHLYKDWSKERFMNNPGTQSLGPAITGMKGLNPSAVREP